MNKRSHCRVFVTQEMPFNYNPAEEFGEVVFCSMDDIRPTSGSMRNERIAAGVAAVLSDYVPGVDYLLPSGSPLTLMVVVAALTARVGNGVTHHVLKWDSQRGRYWPVDIKL